MAEASTPTPETTKTEAPQPQAAQPKENNAGSGKAAIAVNENKNERILQINEKLNSNVLSIDERAKLEDEKKKLESDAQGESNQKNDDDIREDDDNKNSFKEDDIIKYMYNEWMIALFCWAGDKIEKVGKTAYRKLERRIVDRRNNHLAAVKNAKNGNAYKAYETLSGTTSKTCEEISKRDKSRLKTVQDLGQAIADGKMSAESATDLLALANYMGVRADQVQDNPQIKEIVEKSIVHQQNKQKLHETLGITPEELLKNPNLVSQRMTDLKRDPSQKETFNAAKAQHDQVIASQKELCNVGARFAQTESRKITFESALDQTAVLTAEAKVLDQVAHNGKAFEGKDLNEVFKGETAKARTALTEATAGDRQAFIDGQKKNGVHSMGALEKYNEIAGNAANASERNIKKLRIAEMEGGKPRNNVTSALQKMDLMIDRQRKSNQPPSEEKLQEAVQDVSPAKEEKEEKQTAQTSEKVNTAEKTPEPTSLEGEAKERKGKEQELQQTQNNYSDKKLNLDLREQQHNNSPTLARINAIKARQQQKVVSDLAKNNFQGIRMASRGKEM